MKYLVTIELPAAAMPATPNHMEAILNNPNNRNIKVLDVIELKDN